MPFVNRLHTRAARCLAGRSGSRIQRSHTTLHPPQTGHGPSIAPPLVVTPLTVSNSLFVSNCHTIDPHRRSDAGFDRTSCIVVDRCRTHATPRGRRIGDQSTADVNTP